MTTLLTGQLTEQGLREALEFVMDYKDINSAVVDITRGELSGRIGVAWGRFITGATLSTGQRGRLALRELLSWQSGKFTFIDTEGKPIIELRQSLGIDMSAIINNLPNVSVALTPTLYDADELPKDKGGGSQFELEEPTMSRDFSETGLNRLDELHENSLNPPVEAAPDPSEEQAQLLAQPQSPDSSQRRACQETHSEQPTGAPASGNVESVVSLELSAEELDALRLAAQEIAAHDLSHGNGGVNDLSIGSLQSAQTPPQVEPIYSAASMAPPPWSWEACDDADSEFAPTGTTGTINTFAAGEESAGGHSSQVGAFPQPPSFDDPANSNRIEVADGAQLHLPPSPEAASIVSRLGWLENDETDDSGGSQAQSSQGQSSQTGTSHVQSLQTPHASGEVRPSAPFVQPPASLPLRSSEPDQIAGSGEYKYLRLKDASPSGAKEAINTTTRAGEFAANDRLLSAGTMAGAWDAFEALQPQTNRETLLRLRKRQDSDRVGIAVFCFLFFAVSCAGTVMFLPKALIFLAGLFHFTH